MSLMKSLLDRLPTLRNSQDFSVIIPELQQRLDLVEAEADDLKVDLENSLFESPEKLNAVKARIAANLAEQEELKIAISGAERRHQDAIRAETAAEVERRMKEAKKLQATLRTDYIQLHEHLDAATKLLLDIRKRENEVKSANELAAHHKRTDLIVRSPWWHLGQMIGHAGHNEEYPLTGILIRGYFPNKHPDGPALARMKEVKL
ncbi:MAG: hypothetical protein HY852_03480 [Bradyrhizobium sp.]|uniref:hypothetical protein n=1 Tax=Bradyrhizobium sp. TaxID=376 RepID=UPI0025C67550|nr:hypothetical protein [Bradyrhizobium sp.]MBI5260864.1 hypothetical protein [Bradyrhizobium sp.]